MAITISGSGIVEANIADGAVSSDKLATGIDATKLADGTVTSTELQYINTLASNAQTQISAAGVTDVKFLAQPSGLLSNVTGDGTTYSVVFATERFDTGTDFSSATFTAPETGKYLLSTHLMISGVTTNVTRFDLMIVTSNATYTTQTAPADPGSQIDPMFTVIADMDASDTAIVKIYASGEGSDTWDINSGGFSHFCGALLA